MRVFLVRQRTTEANPLNSWHVITNPFRTAFNFFVLRLVRFFPTFAIKRFLLRLTGMRVGAKATVSANVAFDSLHPEYLSIGENSIIGYGCILFTHEFIQHEYRFGKIEIGKNAVIGINSVILPGVKIGDDAMVSACSLVNADVPPGSRVGGVPARAIGGADEKATR